MQKMNDTASVMPILNEAYKNECSNLNKVLACAMTAFPELDEPLERAIDMAQAGKTPEEITEMLRGVK